MAIIDLDPEKACGHQRPLSVHSDTTTTSNLRLSHNTNATRDQKDIEAICASATGEPSGEICDELACTDNIQSRSQTRTPSTRSHPLSIIQRSRRRGLLGYFAIVAEVNNPYDYSNSTKWGITATVTLATAVAPMGSSIFYRMHTSALGLLMRTVSSSMTSWIT